MSALVPDIAELLPWLPALAPVSPLGLLVALVLPPWRGAVLRLTPWAALPALLVALAAPPALLPLPGLLLGGSLQLDQPGRWLLAAVALLWLAGGWLARDWLCRPRRALAWLLATAGALWLPLVGDLPSALAASVLAAYPLYGLLSGGRGGRVLLASVVIADLLILEALLLLAQVGVGLGFDAMAAALRETQARDLVLALLLIGFGAKAGVMGVHYWVAPTVADAPARMLGPTVAFTLAGGLLPLLRLLSIEGVPWPSAAALLPWLALAGCVWAVAAGTLQSTARARTAYALSALATVWLGLLGLEPPAPAPAAVLNDALPPAIAVSGLSVTAMLLACDAPGGRGHLEAWALALLSGLLAMLAVLGAAMPTAAGGDAVDWPLTGSAAAVGLLLGASASRPTRAARHATDHQAQRVAAVLVAGGLCMAVLATLLLPLMPSAATSWSGDRNILTILALVGGFAVGLTVVPALARLPRMPTGDLLVGIERLMTALMAAWTRLGATLGDWRDWFETAIGHLRAQLGQQPAVDRGEAWLRRWSTATLLLLMVGAAVALLAQPG